MPSLAQPNEAAPSEQDRQQLNALATRYAEAANRHHAAAIAALFTEQGVIVSPEGILSGRQAIEKFYRDTFNAAAVSGTAGVGRNNIQKACILSPHVGWTERLRCIGALRLLESTESAPP